jgi:hypothetical protein
MALFGSRPSTPTPPPRPGVPTSPAPKSTSKPIPKPQPVPKPGLFEGGRQVPIKELWRQAKTPTVIPGTGGQKVFKTQHQELIKKYLPYKKVGGYLKTEEAKIILRRLRREETAKGLPPSRDRRILEQDFRLKGKY